MVKLSITFLILIIIFLYAHGWWDYLCSITIEISMKTMRVEM